MKRPSPPDPPEDRSGKTLPERGAFVPLTRLDDSQPVVGVVAAPQPAPAAASSATPTPHHADPALPAGMIRSLEEIERQVRRRSIGHTIAEICLDLSVMPDLCTSRFWNQLFNVMYYFGGGGVIVMKKKQCRVRSSRSRTGRLAATGTGYI